MILAAGLNNGCLGQTGMQALSYACLICSAEMSPASTLRAKRKSTPSWVAVFLSSGWPSLSPMVSPSSSTYPIDKDQFSQNSSSRITSVAKTTSYIYTIRRTYESLSVLLTLNKWKRRTTLNTWDGSPASKKKKEGNRRYKIAGCSTSALKKTWSNFMS